ncbi:ExbD/TolR family protein [Acinetobacter sichuanensis]|uniref:Biopolymer transporter ExbD n=1 Tax=Acinetobacter sichuanensis TaxID=2136183 RepID=A0A371YL00_9GAMM|nr:MULTISPECIES: biopolymer transporter ExbD [Acinetobacter]MDM1247474.1 biopolymer transporter ExbD [Acinetobacter sp. R933-2]MDM1763239.1 biopolymer transporter ExbD [Acinetobacter sp. 226-1]MDM1766718.1 biopolymer transporter ExbD [Acinetobacter sp. 226-4]MDQ9020258.1 biopolymer transporter ExbD [Acinetobacter sichuanensis]RFC82145.1 biopolymer transporter ExbD [Acinetobacter sichuanensis]
MKFKRKSVEDIHINLTPMIDCLLFILVFLLLTTTFNQQSRINLSLPDAQGVPPKDYQHKIEVVVDSSGHYAVNGQALSSKESADLSTAIKQSAQDRRDLMFVIAADAKATHQDVIRVMDVAGQLGFVNINISTKVPSRGY